MRILLHWVLLGCFSRFLCRYIPGTSIFRLNTKLELKALNYRVVQGGQLTGTCISEGGLCMSFAMELILIDGFLWPQVSIHKLLTKCVLS